MPFRYVVASPEDIARMKCALEDGWAEIQRHNPVPVLSVAAERERLAYIITSVWQETPDCDLATTAVREYFSAAVTSSALAEFTKSGDL